MKYVTLIGFLGADAEVKTANGREFTTARVSHFERWTDAAGVAHESTEWVDIIIGGCPAVVDYLKQGTHVCVIGSETLRVYSSAKDRCMKAGATINVRHIELIGGRADAVPSRLYTSNGQLVEVKRYYWAQSPGSLLTNGRGKQFAVDDNGWVFPLAEAQQMAEAQDAVQSAATADPTEPAEPTPTADTTTADTTTADTNPSPSQSH